MKMMRKGLTLAGVLVVAAGLWGCATGGGAEGGRKEQKVGAFSAQAEMQLMEAFSQTTGARIAVIDYKKSHNEFYPDSNAAAGLPEPEKVSTHPVVEQIYVDPDASGKIRVILASGKGVDKKLAGAILLLSPLVLEDHVEWSCQFVPEDPAISARECFE